MEVKIYQNHKVLKTIVKTKFIIKKSWILKNTKGNNMIIRESFNSTNLVEKYIRNDFWREIALPYGEIILPRENKNYELSGSLKTILIDENLMIASSNFNSQHFRRTQSCINTYESEFYILQFIIKGEIHGNFDSKNVSTQIGDLCIIDMTKRFEGQTQSGSRLSIYLPKKQLDQAIKNNNIHGVILKSYHPVVILLKSLLMGLIKMQKIQWIPFDTNAVNEAIISLLSSNLSSNLDDIPKNLYLSNMTIRERALRFIDSYILSPELSPELIQKNLRISRAHLYRAFLPDEGISKIIRNKRLDLAFKDLIKNTKQSYSITQIAFKYGFSSHSQFFRAFRDRFLMTPSDVKNLSYNPYNCIDGLPTLHSYFLNLRNTKNIPD